MKDRENQRKKEESQLEIHLCKICGMKMNPKKCIIHRNKTGHNEFRLSQNNNHKLNEKGGAKMKQKLTVSNAENFARRIYQMAERKEDADFYLLHSKAVAECAKILSKDKNLDAELLEIAAWLHDIGYVVDPDNHAKHSLFLSEKEFDIDKTLKDCIINHGNDGNPQTEEGKIIQIADKASILDKSVLALMFEQRVIKKKDINFIKSMCSKACDLFEKSRKDSNQMKGGVA